MILGEHVSFLSSFFILHHNVMNQSLIFFRVAAPRFWELHLSKPKLRGTWKLSRVERASPPSRETRCRGDRATLQRRSPAPALLALLPFRWFAARSPQANHAWAQMGVETRGGNRVRNTRGKKDGIVSTEQHNKRRGREWRGREWRGRTEFQTDAGVETSNAGVDRGRDGRGDYSVRDGTYEWMNNSGRKWDIYTVLFFK